MKFRSILMTIVAMFIAVAGVSAQDLCFGLDADACAAIAEANNNSLAVQSFNQDFSIDFSIDGVPDSDPIIFNLVGSGPVVLDMMAPFPVVFDATMTVEFGAGPIELQARAVDGVLYIKTPDSEAWQAMPLDELANDAVGMAGVDAGMLDDPTAALGDVPPELLMVLPALLEVPGFLNYTADGDVYTFTADLGALIAAPEFTQVLEGVGEAVGDPTVASLGMMAPMLLSEGLITVEQRVDAELNAVTGLDFGLDATIAAGMLTGDAEAAPIVASLLFSVDISDVNGTFEIVAPENVEME